MRVRDRSRFAAFIMTHGRPDNQITYRVLRREGYTGRVIFLVDNEDPTVPALRERYAGEPDTEVYVFDKAAIAATFDDADTTGDRRSVVYARNACFAVARELGLERFVELDDDYYQWLHRYAREDGKSGHVHVRNLDAVWEAFLDLQDASGAVVVAPSQGGDHIGGVQRSTSVRSGLRRKAMNVMFCRTDRPVEFLGRINEDVNTYVAAGSRGELFLTAMGFQVNQTMTQQAAGGMTDLYETSGTYVKSFYSVMFAPSAVKVNAMGETGSRFHHRVRWDTAVPKIVSGRHRKQS